MEKKYVKKLLSGACLQHCSSLMAEEKPNFVIVVTDDVSWSSFCFSKLFYPYANIDKLATESVRFSNFHGAVVMALAS